MARTNRHYLPGYARSGYYREDKWTSSIGVGSEEFVKKVKNDLGIRARGRKVVGETDDFALREPGAPYVSLFETGNEDIGLDNGVYWNNYPEILDG